MQTWATFSTVDHRAPIYRQALALFDRIVVPIPSAPIGNQTREELDRLSADVAYLAKNDAAMEFPWSSELFQEWRTPLLAEALSAGINRDVFQDSRLMIADELATSGVQAVPVYGGRDHYKASMQQLMRADEALTIEILQRLPVPEFDTPLEDLVKLRQTPAFRTALDDLLEWKRTTVPSIALDTNTEAAVRAAMKDFDRLTRSYASAMEAEGHKKVVAVGSIFLSVVSGELLGTIKEGLVSFRELREPSWKKLSEMKCAPGAVVYHFGVALA